MLVRFSQRRIPLDGSASGFPGRLLPTLRLTHHHRASDQHPTQTASRPITQDNPDIFNSPGELRRFQAA